MKRQAIIPFDKKIREKISAIAAVSQHLPSIVVIINLQSRSVVYMSDLGLKILNTTLPEVIALGPAYFDTYFNPDDAGFYLPNAMEILTSGPPEQIFSFFHQVKNSTGGWDWYLSSHKVFCCDEAGQPFLSITEAHPVKEMKSFTYKIEKALEDQKEMSSKQVKFEQLTRREKEIINFVAHGYSSHAISEKLFLSCATVEQHRKNIKHKLEIKTLPDLVRFAEVFNII